MNSNLIEVLIEQGNNLVTEIHEHYRMASTQLKIYHVIIIIGWHLGI